MTDASGKLLVAWLTRRLGAGLAAVVLVGLLVGLVSAQSSPSYDMSWYTFDSGHGTQTGSNHRLIGTLGESVAGAAFGIRFGMVGGFDVGSPLRYRVHLPVIVRAHP